MGLAREADMLRWPLCMAVILVKKDMERISAKKQKKSHVLVILKDFKSSSLS